MEKKHFNVTIDAPRERVWEVLWGDKSYSEWTAPFSPDPSSKSMVETDWQKGSKTLFTDGSGNGMIAYIDDVRPNEFMSFRHMGEVINGVEDTESERVKKWAGSKEDYTLKDVNGKTELTASIDLDMDSGFADHLIDAFPKALGEVKRISEGPRG